MDIEKKLIIFTHAHDWSGQMSAGCICVFSEHILTHLAHVLMCNIHRRINRSSSSLPMFSPPSPIPAPLWCLPSSHLIFWNSSWPLSTLHPAKLCPPAHTHPPQLPSIMFALFYPPFLFLHYLPPLLLLQQSFFTGFIRGCGTKAWEGAISGCYCLLLSSPHLVHMCTVHFWVFSSCSPHKRLALGTLFVLLGVGVADLMLSWIWLFYCMPPTISPLFVFLKYTAFTHNAMPRISTLTTKTFG